MTEGRLIMELMGSSASLISHLSSLTFILLLLTSCEQPYVAQEKAQDNKTQEQSTSTNFSSDLRACTLYKGHVIAYSKTFNNDSVQLTLISLNEWTNLPSALNTESPEQALQLAYNYQENGLTGWHIPTTDEVKQLRSYYATSATTLPPDTTYNDGFQITISSDPTPFNLLNTLLTNQQATVVTLTTGTTNARYLCDEGTKTFSFVTNTTISKAGTKVTTYRLRLLKTLVFF